MITGVRMRMRLNLRALARVKVGLGKMHWMAEQILNATAPRDVWPLLHEGKLVVLLVRCEMVAW